MRRLVQRNRTGEGAAVEVPMFEAFTSFTLLEHLYGLTYDPPVGDAGYERLLSTERRPFRTADGWLGVVFYDDRHWRAFFETIGRPELAVDPRFAEHNARTIHTDQLYAMVAEAMLTRTSAQWIDVLRRLDVPAMPVLSVADVLTDPHLTSVGLFVTEDHPVTGRYTKVRNPLVFSTGLDDGRVPPSTLGQHTADVLGELGYDADGIAALGAAGAVLVAP